MDTHSPSQLLEAQHRLIDEGLQGAMDGSGGAAELAGSLELLRLHLYVEEAVLFPALEKTGLTMPVFVMQREHGLMWPLMESLVKACAEGAGLDALQDDCEELFQLLQVHNPKEEQILYGAADEIAGEDAALLPAIADARMPQGWLCRAAVAAAAKAAR